MAYVKVKDRPKPVLAGDMSDTPVQHLEGNDHPEARPDDGLPEKNASNDSGGSLSPETPVPATETDVPGETSPSCALDTAPVHSKIVVVRHTEQGKVAVFMTPAGERKLPDDDVGHKLPEGARIHKDTETQYTATQIGMVDDRQPLVTGTAREAIARFGRHFHDVG